MTGLRYVCLVVLGTALAGAGCTRVPSARSSPYHASDAEVSVTRIVHGSLVVSLHGTRVLVDPWFHGGLVFRQSEALGMLPDDLPAASAVLLTHGHRDHFDAEVLRAVAKRTPVAIAPADLADALRSLGFTTVTTLGWWDTTRLGDVTVTAVPAAHAVRENGYVIERGAHRVYVAGDTRPYPDLVDVATRFPKADVALLPIGGQRLFGVRREMTPEEAAAAAKLLGAVRVIPTHYGETGGFPFYWYASDPVARFRAACEREGVSADRIVVLQPGESWHDLR